MSAEKFKLGQFVRDIQEDIEVGIEIGTRNDLRKVLLVACDRSTIRMLIKAPGIKGFQEVTQAGWR